MGLIHECQVLAWLEEGIFHLTGLPRTQRAGVRSACRAERLSYFLEPRSRFFRMRGKLIRVDVFQTSHICIVDIFISLKMGLAWYKHSFCLFSQGFYLGQYIVHVAVGFFLLFNFKSRLCTYIMQVNISFSCRIQLEPVLVHLTTTREILQLIINILQET